ncbi:MAG: hypothetical protein EAZ39_30550 [Oscillatoriales cyanobacterium]|nr:MAG: hypothetical protein EAZ45_28000 [Oscillatoriales cyanobacterium]TAG12601.1 MAG: hypothetical protein EAZ39_30550 [Oscillatoriales cyanobacterium]TAG46310.1 MAG: hypothetical protein EAZ33_06390 [Oscillatoriales cyanobacterium]TAG62277.1 MAG: hypothetical protein EAZ28_03150 [Oscillatoriales cyanobacterium]
MGSKFFRQNLDGLMTGRLESTLTCDMARLGGHIFGRFCKVCIKLGFRSEQYLVNVERLGHNRLKTSA